VVRVNPLDAAGQRGHGRALPASARSTYYRAQTPGAQHPGRGHSSDAGADDQHPEPASAGNVELRRNVRRLLHPPARLRRVPPGPRPTLASLDQVVQHARLTLVPAGELTPERRCRLLETAAREFATKGYEHASLNAIIRDCDMSKSSFYHYVGSKAALFDVVVQEAMRELARVLDIPAPQELAGPHYWDTVTRLVTEVLAVAARADWYADVGRLFYLPDAPVQHRPIMGETVKSVAAWVDQALASGRACGAIRDDLPLSLQLALVNDVLRCLDHWSLQHLHEYPEPAQVDITRIQIDVLRRLLAP